LGPEAAACTEARVHLAESLLASVPPLGEEMTKPGNAEVERREREIERGPGPAISDTEFWQQVEVVSNNAYRHASSVQRGAS